MSQPPPPPNQPPPGGFGAPQDPSPGGFGAPQSPPPAPGYGYPQAPPQPGYGYPQTSPPAQPGYGYANQPPGYGYPQPPTTGMPPGPPQGGRRGPGAAVWIVVAAVAAIALIVGGGVMYANLSGDDDSKNNSSGTGGSSGSPDDKGGTGGTDSSGGAAKEKAPANPSAKVLFQVPAPEIKDRQQIDSVTGSWLTDSIYAKSGVNKIVGYDADSGATKWTLPLNGQTCAGSPEISDSGIAVVLTESAKRTGKNDRKPCTDVSTFEVATGKKLWTKSVATSGAKIAFGEVTISGTTVAVGGGYNGGAAFDLNSGKILWQPKTGSCSDVGYAGGPQLVAVRKCGPYDSEKYEVQLLDPKSGSVKWSYKLPNGIDNAKVISTKPVVFGLDSGEPTTTGASDVFSLDDSGKLLTKITLADGKYQHDCELGKVHECHGITVGNGKLYVPTKEHEGSGSSSLDRTNEIIAFSLATGKTTGDKIDAGAGYEIFPIRMDGGNILAYKDGPYDKGAQVVSADGKTLKQTKLLETPGSDAVISAISSMVPETSELLYTDGRLFMGKDLVSKGYSGDTKQYTALGFGAK